MAAHLLDRTEAVAVYNDEFAVKPMTIQNT